MGIYDRDYIRRGRRGGNPLASVTQTAVGTIILLNVVVWMAQLITRPSPNPFGIGSGDLGAVTSFLAARPSEVFGFQVWKLITANFAHSTAGVWHLLGNMLFLYFFGRELEQIYGRRDFYILYLGAGVLAILAEVTALGLTGKGDVPVLGASGAVMAVTVLFALFYPNRTIVFMFFIPAPVWLLCVIYIAADVFGVLSPHGDGVAHLAHLTGAAVGLIYRFYDLRWHNLRRLLVGSGKIRRAVSTKKATAKKGKIVPFPGPMSSTPSAPEPDPVSQRIDKLLAKISSEGKESLTEEEWSFLKENSGRYRST